MLIKKIILKNIRSYIKQEIDFPRGTVLLSGDIGSGKSSILYALDFVLFGITKDLSGSTLLRNGARDGSVELHFEVEGKDIVITRSLKRGSSVTQSFGSLVMDGVKRELTAVELKQKILELLQYPQDLLTKKSLIFRYTVYTPQDEMKNILSGEGEVRVDTLRKVFGIDKYKRVRDNDEIFLKMLKGRMRQLEDSIKDVDERRKEAASLRSQFQQIQIEIEKVVPKLTALQDEINEFKQKAVAVEQDTKLFHEQQKELRVVETALLHYSADMEKYKKDLPALKGELASLEQQIAGKQITADGNKAQELEAKIRNAEERLRELRSKMQECQLKIEASNKNIRDIEKLDVCPLCRQQVHASHVALVKKNEQDHIQQMTSLRKNLEQEEQMLLAPLENLKQNLEDVKKALHEKELVTFQLKTLDEKTKRMQEMQTAFAAVEQQIVESDKNKRQLQDVLSGFSGKEKEYLLLREKIDNLAEEEKMVMMEKVSLEKEKSVFERDLLRIDEEIAAFEQEEQMLRELSRLRDWMEQCFAPMVEVMERQVMLKVHRDFDMLFQKWFLMLVDSEVMKIRLDEEFSPVIEQNGYEIDYNFLSGGEKTAAALAYRLALNQVVNTMLSTIKTRGLLILDEPTDGFSSDQLDRMRDLLDELDAEQIIIVSHETKIESFVNSVIRIEKQEHVSKVV